MLPLDASRDTVGEVSEGVLGIARGASFGSTSACWALSCEEWSFDGPKDDVEGEDDFEIGVDRLTKMSFPPA